MIFNSMSKRRDKQAEYKNIKRFLEFSKDPIKRLKSLKQGLEKNTVEEIKAFYLEHSSTIFYCIYSSFTIIETNIQEKVLRGKGYNEFYLKDLSELVLPALQRVLEFLPELIHKRWQFNSVCLILRKLLHPNNCIKLRQNGIKLLVLWVQALQENAGDACMELFASAIPFFPPEKTPMGLPATSSGHTSSNVPCSSSLGLCERYGIYSSSPISSIQDSVSSARVQSSGGNANRDVVLARVVYPLSPPSDLNIEAVTMELIDFLLKCLTTQLHNLYWEDPLQYVRGFAFLFFLFKLFYLAPLYKEFRTEAGLYTDIPPPSIDLPEPPTQLGKQEILHPVTEEVSPESDGSEQPTPLSTPPLSGSSRKKYVRNRSSPYRMSSVIKLEYDTSNPIYAKVKDLILKYLLMWILPSSGSQRGSGNGDGVSGSPAPSPMIPRHNMFIPCGAELMKEMWYTNRDNVSLLLEICRVGLSTPLSRAPTLRKLLDLYFHWQQAVPKPLFMQPPPVQSYGETTTYSDPTPSAPRPTNSSQSLPDTGGLSTAQTRPFILSWEQLSCYAGFKPNPVQAGLQASTRMIILHTSQVFLKRADTEMELTIQVELCRKIIRLYQDIGLSWIMEHDTWEYMLAMLLHLTVLLLSGPPNSRTTLGGALAGSVVKTLLVYYVRASIVTVVSQQLWDNLLSVLSSLTHWEEVVEQWQFVMNSMTQVLAQTVYNLNLNDLSLDRLELEDKSRTHRPRLQTAGPKDLASSRRMESFSTFNVVQNTSQSLKGGPAESSSNSDPLVTNRATQTKSTTRVLKKSSTLDASNSPLMDGHPGVRKRASMPEDKSDELSYMNIPRLTALVESNETQQNPEEYENINDLAIKPSTIRSISTSDIHFVKTESRQETTPVDPMTYGAEPSPGTISLPADFHLKNKDTIEEMSLGRGTDHSALLAFSKEREEAGKELVLINCNIDTPSSPELVLNETTFSTTLNDSDDKAVAKGSSLSAKVPHVGVLEKQPIKTKASSPKRFLFHAPWSTESSGSKSQRHKELRTDLVLMNESLSDLDLGQSKPKQFLSASNISLDSENESQLSKSVVVQRSDSPDFSKPKISLVKSLSEGNIHRILLNSDTFTSTPTSMKGDQPHSNQHIIKRMLNSNPNSPGGASQTHCVTDAFSSEIFPHSRKGVLTATGPSPARAGVGYSRKISVECVDKVTSGHVAEVDVKLVVTPGSPTQPESRVCSTPVIQSGGIGWTPAISSITWLKMLRILGDINNIHSPVIHSEAMTCLQSVWKSLFDMSLNLGVSVDNQSTPPLPEFTPPLFILIPWVVEACSLTQGYVEGRVKAYQLLCQMTIQHWPTLPPQLHLVHFYRLMHTAFQPSSDMLHVAVKHGCKLFVQNLPGSSVLLEDAISASTAILSTTQTSFPRIEALYLLGSLICLPDLYPTISVTGESCEDEQVGVAHWGVVVETTKLKERIIDALFRAARVEPTRVSRTLALYQVGILVLTDIQSGNPSPRLLDGIDILLASMQFADRCVSMTAVDTLSMLVEVAPQLQEFYPELPCKLLGAICYAIAVLMAEELDRALWVDKVVVTLILCLRDWLMALPTLSLIREGGLDESTVKSIFEVLQVAAGSRQQIPTKQLFTIKNLLNVELDPIDNTTRSPRGGQSGRTLNDLRPSSSRKSGEDVQISSEKLSTSTLLGTEEKERIQIAARSVLAHLVNLLGHFPFACGSAQMSSSVSEFHDCPSLQHLTELSTDVFDSPRVQFFSFNDTVVITIIEIPAKLDGVPHSITAAKYQTRLIVRDVSGKYTWDCSVLYGPEEPSSLTDIGTPSLVQADSMDSLVECPNLNSPYPCVQDPLPACRNPLEPPSWRTHINTGRDVLEDLLLHVERTSPECLLFPGDVGLCEPVPIGESGSVGMSLSGYGEKERRGEEQLLYMLEHQQRTEQVYIKEALTLPSMQAAKASAPQYFPNSLAFHHCRLFLAHLGMLSWEKRNHLDLLEKNNQLILELKHLDNLQAQSRQTYKVAVLYVGPGQEDKTSIFSNESGSRDYEEFIAGLGWEVEMNTHTGYNGGLKKEFSANCTLPYYATSSEEILFHVSTRLPLKIHQKVRHLGNDEVHIVWSEHWRDYRRTIFRTQFADVLLVIYPLRNGLYRIQINKRKSNLPPFGPLFDGALVNRTSLPALVRATAINGLRAQRSPFIGYRGRYVERLKNIQAITDKKLKSSFEQFSENVMHPLEMTSTQSILSIPTLTSLRKPYEKRAQPGSSSSLLKPTNQPSPHSSFKSMSSLSAQYTSPFHQSLQTLEQHSPKAKPSRLKSLESAPHRSPSPLRRERALTGDDSRMPSSQTSEHMRRNSSVPDLSEIKLKVKSESSTPILKLSPSFRRPGTDKSTTSHILATSNFH